MVVQKCVCVLGLVCVNVCVIIFQVKIGKMDYTRYMYAESSYTFIRFDHFDPIYCKRDKLLSYEILKFSYSRRIKQCPNWKNKFFCASFLHPFSINQIKVL